MSQSNRDQSMTNGHRYFLQSFMLQGILTGREIFELLKYCCDNFEGGEIYQDDRKAELLLDYCRTINDSVKPYGMEIKKGMDEHEGHSFYGLVNTTENAIALAASAYTDNELEFFKKLIEGIVKSETGLLGSISAIHISSNLGKKMSQHDADTLLLRLEHEKWIGKTLNGKYYLGARTLMEMDQYILEMYEDFVVRCNLCKKLCVLGQACEKCSIKVHRHCALKLFKKRPEKLCPECKEPWPVSDAMNSSSLDDSVVENQTPSQSQTGRKRKATS